MKRKFDLKENALSALKAISTVTCDALYPQDITCDVCGGELIAESRYRLCSACAEKMPFIDGKICLVCGGPVHNEADYCVRCQNTESVFKLNRSPLVYDKDAKALILALKFGKKQYIAKTLGAMMSDRFISEHMNAEIIVPVPMSTNELKKRGFNQAELLANEVGKRLGLPVLPALIKNRDTASQKQLTREERTENLKDAFSVVFKEVRDRRILLVDDVFTTGATANECAKALLKARCKDVSVLTAAVTAQRIFMD